MGLTKQSVGMGAVDSGLEIKKQTPDDKIIAIAGNPNVGKKHPFQQSHGNEPAYRKLAWKNRDQCPGLL